MNRYTKSTKAKDPIAPNQAPPAERIRLSVAKSPEPDEEPEFDESEFGAETTVVAQKACAPERAVDHDALQQQKIAAEIADTLNSFNSSGATTFPYTMLDQVGVCGLEVKETKKPGYTYKTLNLCLGPKGSDGQVRPILTKKGSTVTCRIVTPNLIAPQGVKSPSIDAGADQSGRLNIFASLRPSNPEAMRFAEDWNEHIHKAIVREVEKYGKSFTRNLQALKSAINVDDEGRLSMSLRIEDYKADEKRNLAPFMTEVFDVSTPTRDDEEPKKLDISELINKRFHFYAVISVPFVRDAANRLTVGVFVRQIYITRFEDSLSSKALGSVAAKRIGKYIAPSVGRVGEGGEPGEDSEAKIAADLFSKNLSE